MKKSYKCWHAIRILLVVVVCTAVLASFSLRPTRAAGTRITVAGISYRQLPPGMTLCRGCAPPSTGWVGPPVFSDPEQITLLNGNTVYIVRAKGISGASGSDNAVILATDDWRKSNTSYDRVTDTILTTSGRRKGTPVEGVIAILAPTVEGQSTDPNARLVGRILVPGFGVREIEVEDDRWKANTVPLRYGAGGPEVTVSADPWEESDHAIGVKWGSSIATEPPSVTAETVLSSLPFEVTVEGYLEDLSSGSVFAYPDYRLGSGGTVVIPLMQGRTFRKRMTVSYGGPTATVINTRTSLSYSPAPGVTIVDPPPTPHILRSAIYYVPGDMRYVPDKSQ